jgi:Domain of Unknown Function with PDB structure (DUF3857)/Transglutaminase-like superfamily
MKRCTFILLLAISSFAHAQLNYAASAIPDSLKKNAHAVYRVDEAVLKIISPSKYKYQVHHVVTLLDENAEHHLFHTLGFDKFIKVDEVKITVYNQDGASVKSYNRKDFTTRAAYSDNDLLTDNKIMYLQTPAPGYPCTVEMSYEQTFNSYINIPDWYFSSPDQSVELSKYTVQVPSTMDIRYRSKGINLPPVITTNGDSKQYYWEMRNLLAKKAEPRAFTNYAQFPMIELAPNEFSYDDYAGKQTTWADFGAWSHGLFKEAASFDEPRKAQIAALLQGAATQKEKIARLYKYVQQNMRYVSIQLGIGGFRPFAVSFVDNKKYGDCKALANYMHNLLEVAGIPSWPALVNAGRTEEPADPNFPSNVFNHVILCAVPDGDTTWLECTSNTSEVGKLGAFTENRYALLLTEQGGKLVPTPKSKPADNLFAASSTIALADDGTGSSKTKFSLTGEYIQEFLSYIGEEKKDDQKRYLIEYQGFLQPDDFEISFDKQVPLASAELNMNIEKIPSFTAGSKMFLSPRIYKIWSNELPATNKRISDFLLGTPFVKSDTTVYQLPEGYGVDNLPQSKKLSFDYGSFTTTYTWDATKKSLTSTARLEVKERIIPAAKYAAAKKFFDEVLAEFNEKIVVKKL